MSEQKKESRLDLTDPAIVSSLEGMVFGKSASMRADQWIGALALLLVANQDKDIDIEMNVNGIRINMSLLPPGEDMKPDEDGVADFSVPGGLAQKIQDDADGEAEEYE